MDKLKALLLNFVKPLVVAHIKDLSMLTPLLSKVLQDKAKLSQTAADPLAMDLVIVIEEEIQTLINKI